MNLPAKPDPQPPPSPAAEGLFLSKSLFLGSLHLHVVTYCAGSQVFIFSCDGSLQRWGTGAQNQNRVPPSRGSERGWLPPSSAWQAPRAGGGDRQVSRSGTAFPGQMPVVYSCCSRPATALQEGLPLATGDADASDWSQGSPLPRGH